MAGNDDGLALPREAPEHGAERYARTRVETGGRFIQQEHVGVVDERPGEAEPLLLAPGKDSGRRVRVFTQAHFGEQFRRTVGDRRRT